ncbi:MAG: glycosyl transferase family 2 [archaeon]|nr:glycosyl transferase family 2 [archaeon]MCP8305961.1 glycosyl transferase family 2 [archaeon]
MEVNLRPEILEKIDELKPVDIIVGILTKNVETTIVHVLNVVSIGLVERFPHHNNLVLVSNGFSSDRTTEMAKLFGLTPRINKMVLDQVIGSGKGNGIRTVLEVAHQAKAKAVALVDGDLLSIKPDWISLMIEPIMFGIADLVVPHYVRDKCDGVITNNLAYPFTRALYNTYVRQPIGGDFGLSFPLIERLLEHPLFPQDFGVDIFLTTVAAAERFNLQEAILGLKLHTSTSSYIDPGAHLTLMFRQVVGTMFDLAIFYEKFWKEGMNTVSIPRRQGKYYGQIPVPVKVDLERTIRLFKDGFEDYKEVLKNNLENEIFKSVEEMIREGESMGPSLWTKIVYSLFRAYKNSEEKNRTDILDALRVMWMGRFSSYVLETKDMSYDDAMKIIEEQAEIFEKEKRNLIDL